MDFDWLTRFNKCLDSTKNALNLSSGCSSYTLSLKAIKIRKWVATNTNTPAYTGVSNRWQGYSWYKHWLKSFENMQRILQTTWGKYYGVCLSLTSVSLISSRPN